MAEVNLDNESTIDVSLQPEETITSNVVVGSTLNATVPDINYIPGYEVAEAERRANEVVRQSNETDRIALYDDMVSKVSSGYFNGTDGEDGFSPIANVSKSGNTATISITDKNGTTSATVSDGTNGTNGTNGTDGFSPTITSSKSGKTTTLTITDINGTTTATILDGEDGYGSGDMLKSVYDTDNDGIVDNAEKVNNHTVGCDVPSDAVFTDTTYSNLSDFNNDLGFIDNTVNNLTNYSLTSTIQTNKNLTKGIEYIEGTQTAQTNKWTGVSTDTGCSSGNLYVGKTIIYHLPYAGNNSGANLKLTLPDGTTTAEIGIRRQSNTAISQTYEAGCDILMVYNGTYWKVNADYDSNTDTIGYQLRINNGIFKNGASTSIYRYQLLVETSNGLEAFTSTSNKTDDTKTQLSPKYIPGGQILYYGSTTSVSSGASITASSLWQQYVVDVRYSFNISSGITADKPVYIKMSKNTDGTLSPVYSSSTGGHPLVYSLPSTADGYVYVYLGNSYNGTAGHRLELSMRHPIFEYKNGKIRNYIEENDPIFTASASYGISSSDITNWNNKEDISNKTTSISSSSTNTQYPSAKAVYDLHSVTMLTENTNVWTLETGYYTTDGTVTLSYYDEQGVVKTLPANTTVYLLKVASLEYQGIISSEMDIDSSNNDYYKCFQNYMPSMSMGMGSLSQLTTNGTILYDDASGSNGTILLNDSVANYTYIEMFYRSNDNDYSSVKVYHANNKRVYLSISRANTATPRVYVKVRTVAISGNQIGNHDDNSYCEYVKNSNSTGAINKTNNIYIMTVVGYK